MFSKIQQIAAAIDFSTIPEERKKILLELTTYIKDKREKQEAVNLNFICTHNSRRSQFSQVWAKVASVYYNVACNSFSSGAEVTAFNPRAVASLEKFGFRVEKNEGKNPVYTISFSEQSAPLKLFSKRIEDSANPDKNFAAIMTCSHADENCPVVFGADARIPVRYEDPKKYDDTPLEETFYDYRSFEIATELFYVFSNIQ